MRQPPMSAGSILRLIAKRDRAAADSDGRVSEWRVSIQSSCVVFQRPNCTVTSTDPFARKH